jgi:hypothetical protein
MGLSEVSATLWRERNLLEMLVFKLEEEQLVVASGRGRWLAHATREVEAVLDRIRQAEIMRAMEVDDIAPSLGLRPGCSLRELAECTPSPWSSMFEDHRVAFLALTEEICSLAQANKDLLARGAKAVRDTLDAVTSAQGAPKHDDYGFATSGSASPTGRALVFDEAI